MRERVEKVDDLGWNKSIDIDHFFATEVLKFKDN